MQFLGFHISATKNKVLLGFSHLIFFCILYEIAAVDRFINKVLLVDLELWNNMIYSSTTKENKPKIGNL